MTILFEHNCEGAADEADVAATTTGFGTPWAFVNKTTGMTIKYDSALSSHGSRSIRYTRAATTDNGYTRATLASAVTRMQFRFYVYVTDLPGAGVDLVVFRSASGFMGYMSLGFGAGGTVDGNLVFRDAGGAAITASRAASAIPLNQWVRIEGAIKAGTGTTDGTFEYSYYLLDSGTAIGTPYSSAARNTGTVNPIEARTGLNGTSTTPQSIWIDDFALGDGATGLIGPVSVTNAAPSVSLTAAQNVGSGAAVSVSATATDSDGSIASYAWSVVAASSTSTPTLSGASTATVSFTAPAAGNLITLQCIVTDNGGATATATTQVLVPLTGTTPIRPLALATTGTDTWNVVGSATPGGAALADEDGTTYIESSALTSTETTRRIRLQPANARSALVVKNTLSTDTGTANVTVRLFEGSTLRQSWTHAITATPTEYADTVSAPTITAIGDWTALYVEVAATA